MSLSHEDVLQILALLDASDFDELRLETSDYKLHVRRSIAAADGGADASSATPLPSPAPAPPVPPAAPIPPTPSVAPVPPIPPVAPLAPVPPAAPAASGTPAVALIDVKTPLLGTFYRSPQPGAPPFVDVGARVEPDTVVGIVEVMKLMSSVAAGAAGVISEVLAKDGGLVEYGEVLMRIAPDAA